MLSEKHARWIKNTCIVIILVTVFSGFADKHNVLGMCIAGGAGIVITLYTLWWYPTVAPKGESRENEHYLTIRELIDRLEKIEDDTSVVVDSNGYPITSISILADADFGDATWLRGFENSRRLYREERTICQQQKKS